MSTSTRETDSLLVPESCALDRETAQRRPCAFSRRPSAIRTADTLLLGEYYTQQSAENSPLQLMRGNLTCHFLGPRPRTR